MFEKNNETYKKDEHVWAYKHAPKKFGDLILLDRMVSNFEKMIKTKQIPDTLLYGPAGLGKTTIANVLKNELNLDVLFINGSIETSIDNIRDSVKTFTRKYSTQQKMVFIDECDRISINAMDSLKAEIEACQKTIFFFTSNHIEKIIDPLVSRCGGGLSFFYDQNEKKELQKKYLKRMFYILDQEEVEYDQKAIAKIITKCFPDFRNTIHSCQLIYNQFGSIKLSHVDTLSVDLDVIFNLIKSKQFDKMRYYVANMTNYNSVYSAIINKIENYVDNEDIPKVIDLCYEHSKASAITNDPQIPMIHFFVQMMNVNLK